MAGSRVAHGLAVVVLAAGKGTRMRSARAKVLHEVCGVPMLGHIRNVASELKADRVVVVVGRDGEAVREAYGEEAEFVVQAEQLGTGHAVLAARTTLKDFEGDVFVLYGDTPLLRAGTLEEMRRLKAESGADLVMLTAGGDIPGRVIRDAQGRVVRIVEAQDATPEELAVPERNTGVYLVSSSILWARLEEVDAANNQGEIYLTDIVGHSVRAAGKVEALWLEDADECLGINDRSQLAEANRIMCGRVNEGLMKSGVTLVDPATTYIDVGVEVGRDTVIEPGCFIAGSSVIGVGVHIKANCYIEDSRLDDGVVFGPYSHLRPNSHLMSGVRIGNFVEVKNATLGRGSRSAHLTYIGDADVGEDVNFGCGSVVVNYDGYAKHRSRVGDGAFVGCNVNLISPVEIESHAFLAAGSTITQRVPEDALAVARARQRNIEGWVARKEARGAGGKPRRVAGDPEQADSGRRKSAPKKATRKKAAGKKAARKKATRKKAARKKATGKKAARKKATGKKAARKQAVRKKTMRRKPSRK